MKNKGISLIVLVITIIVIIILAGAVILTLSNNNVMGTANEAVFKQNVTNYKTEVNMYTMEQLVATKGDFDVDTVNVATKNLKTVVTSLIKKDEGKFEIQKGELVYIGTDANEKKWFASMGNSEVTPSKPEIGKIVDKNTTMDGKTTGTYHNPIIPKGFMPVNATIDSSITSDWNKIATDSNEYKKGLVIQDEIGNQFVWIGIDGINVKFERKDFGKGVTIAESLELTTTDEYIAMQTSVNGTQGFYLARYEAGVPTKQGVITTANHATAQDGSIKPVSKKGYGTWNFIPWGTVNDEVNPGNGAVTVARSMYKDTGKNVVSTLCYDIQWDTVMQFIALTDSTYPTDSTGKGNYAKSLALTGSNDNYRVCNIYDMAGNDWEWTMAKYSTDDCFSRGTNYNGGGSNGPAAYRYNFYFGNSNVYFGFRSALSII